MPRREEKKPFSIGKMKSLYSNNNVLVELPFSSLVPSISPQGSLAIERKLIFPFVSKTCLAGDDFSHTKKKFSFPFLTVTTSPPFPFFFSVIFCQSPAWHDLFFSIEFFFLWKSAKKKILISFIAIVTPF